VACRGPRQYSRACAALSCGCLPAALCDAGSPVQSLQPANRCRIDVVGPRYVRLCLAGSKTNKRYFTAEAFRMIYDVLGVSLEQIEASHQRLKEYLRTMDIPGVDPAISDMATAELEEAYTRLLRTIVAAVKIRMAKR